MTLAIMQPYVFPYIGYFQLIAAVDKFIIYDDVNYIKQGWINRNSILIGNKSSMFTIPLVGSSSNKLINEIYTADLTYWRKGFFKTIEQNYKKAPFFEETFEILNNVIRSEPESVSSLCLNSLTQVMRYLDIKTSIVETSSVYNNRDLKAQSRVLDICAKEAADHYINPIGGTELYSKEDFLLNGIHLHFIKTKPIVYKQFNENFIPWLSIIDVLMFNSPSDIKKLLSKYDLL